MEHTASYYAASANQAPSRPALQREETCDVCIVGAGFTGLSAALHLAELGLRVIVLEAAKIGWGASGRNGGQLVNGYSRDFDTIRARYGEETASALQSMAFEGSDIIRSRIKDYAISCDYKEGGFFAAFTPAQMSDLACRKEVWERFGNKSIEIFSREKMDEVVGTDIYCGGLLDRRGGHFHPLNYCLGVAAAIEKNGGKIFEDSKVLRMEKEPKPVVHTAQGKVRAEYLVLCGNAYMAGVAQEIERRVMPVSTQVIATEVLGDETARKILPSDYCLEDCNYFLDYYRISGDKRLLFGGGLVYGGTTPENITGELWPKAVKTFPFLAGKKVEFAWSGNCAFTFTRIPHVGRINERVYFAHGYSGHGVTTSNLMGKLVAEAINHQAERFDLFAGVRNFPFPGGRMFRIPLTVLGAWYYRVKERLDF